MKKLKKMRDLLEERLKSNSPVDVFIYIYIIISVELMVQQMKNNEFRMY